MELLPADIRSQIPALYSQEETKDPIVYVKFFSPSSNWTWYVTEFDGEDLCFGLVKGFETEWGYFSLQELQAVRDPLGLPIERDLHFKPTPLSQIQKQAEMPQDEILVYSFTDKDREDPTQFLEFMSKILPDD